MSDHQSTSKHPLFESIVDKLSPQNSSWDAMFAKLGVSYTGLLAGITLSDLFTFASLVYVMLNIYVLLRDKVFKKKDKSSAGQERSESNLSSGD